MTKINIQEELEICKLVIDKFNLEFSLIGYISPIYLCLKIPSFVKTDEFIIFIRNLYEFGIENKILKHSNYPHSGFDFVTRIASWGDYNKQKSRLLKSYEQHLKDRL